MKKENQKENGLCVNIFGNMTEKKHMNNKRHYNNESSFLTEVRFLILFNKTFLELNPQSQQQQIFAVVN